MQELQPLRNRTGGTRMAYSAKTNDMASLAAEADGTPLLLRRRRASDGRCDQFYGHDERAPANTPGRCSPAPKSGQTNGPPSR